MFEKKSLLRILSAGLLSKGLGFVVQALAITLGVRYLGTDGYAQFSIYVAYLVFQSAAQVFGGPNLTAILSVQDLSKTVRQQIYLNSLLSTTIVAACCSVFFIVSYQFGAVDTIFEKFILSVGIVWVSILIRSWNNSFVRVLTAEGKFHTALQWIAVGNAFSIMLFIPFCQFPSVNLLLFIVYIAQPLPFLVFQMVNVILQRDCLSKFKVSWGIQKTLFFGGVSYLMFELSSSMPRELTKFAISSELGVREVAAYSAIMSISVIVRNSATLLFGPLIPLVKKAISNNNVGLVKSTLFKLCLLSGLPLLFTFIPDDVVFYVSKKAFVEELVLNSKEFVAGGLFLSSLLIKYWVAYFLIGFSDTVITTICSLLSVAVYFLLFPLFDFKTSYEYLFAIAALDIVFFCVPGIIKIMSK